MSTPNMSKYCALMDEVKKRTHVIDALVTGRINLLYNVTTVEAAFLQVRKILESIALASLVANEDAYRETRDDIDKQWHAQRILNRLTEIHPDFYPTPIIQGPGEGKIKSNWLDRENDYLTKDEFIKLYDMCGDMAHVKNPFDAEPSINYDTQISEALHWMTRIRNLLNAHSIRLMDDPNLYLVQMAAQDTFPTFTTFAPYGGEP